MNDLNSNMKTLPRRASAWILATLFVPLLFTGCGSKKDEGIEAIFLAEFNGTTGVGDNDSYPDGFLTPSTIKVGVRSVRLIYANEPDKEPYIIFEKTEPIVLDLDTNTQSAETNPVFPTDCPCEFSKVRVEMTFVDMQVPVYDDDIAVNRRFRFYTLDPTDPDLEAPVKAGEVLVGDTTDTPSFSWINMDAGAFVSLTETRPTVPLQVPASRFPNDAYAPTITIDLPSFFKVSDKPKGILTVTLTVHAGQIFFYDETDTEAPAMTRFDRFTDGRLNANEPDSHFYPTFPAITAAGE